MIDPAGREVARHRRSYDRGARVEDERHLVGLAIAKRAARDGRGRDRLRSAVPQATEFLEEVVRRNQSLGSATQQLTRLLDTHGPAVLGLAIGVALERGTCAPSAVAHLIEQAQRSSGTLPPVPIDLPDHIKARERRVKPHSLESYDDHSRTDHDEQD